MVIIGGGAAGLFCGIEAGMRGRRVLILEKNSQVGRKIIISGGGRCNFTNLHTSAENFVSRNPHFSKSALARYTPEDFIALVRKHRIEYYEKKLGQLFCRESSKQIVEMLLKEAGRARAQVRTSCTVHRVERESAMFRLSTSLGEFECESLVIATGGLSFPKIGATDLGYKIARQFGLAIEPTRPSLVPLVLDNGINTSKLAGISIDAVVRATRQSFRENILFTHHGLSGPAILQISNYWTPRSEVSIDLLPATDATSLIDEHRQSRRTVGNILGRFLPDRVVDAILPSDLLAKHACHLTDQEAAAIGGCINNWRVSFRKSEGYDRAEVTLGGVSTAELSSQTLESKKVPGLYFIGEIVDVTGWLGGYNFQWAWASGHAAGQAV